MSVIDRTDRESVPEAEDAATTAVVDDGSTAADHAPDRTPAGHVPSQDAPTVDHHEVEDGQVELEDGQVAVEDGQVEGASDPGPREIRFRAPKGMRIRRIRLKSVLKIASVFFVLGYLVTMASLVVIWNVAQGLGFIENVEETMVSSLGLDSFDIVGQELFDLAVVGIGLLFAMGLVVTLLLTIVYNATCALLGGLAVETGSLRRPKRIFSLRHRRFITVR